MLLSELIKIGWMELSELIDYMLDNGHESIINDLTPAPNIEYSLDDILIIWPSFKKYFDV